jgi:hypothetical protein
MKHSELFDKAIKRPLLLAIVATFAVAGCSSTPSGQSYSNGSSGMQGPIGASGSSGAPRGNGNLNSSAYQESGSGVP